MVWITEWSHCGRDSINVVVSNDELQANSIAASMIMNIIHDEWDLSNEVTNDHALFISDQFASLNWVDGIRRFNECESNKCSDDAQQMRVYERKPETRIYPIKLLRALPATKEFDLESFLKDSDPPPPLG